MMILLISILTLKSKIKVKPCFRQQISLEIRPLERFMTFLREIVEMKKRYRSPKLRRNLSIPWVWVCQLFKRRKMKDLQQGWMRPGIHSLIACKKVTM